MKRTIATERVRLAGLMLPSVEACLRAMVADGVPDPIRTLRGLLADTTGEDDVARRRYGPMVRAIWATFTYRRNRPLVAMAFQDCIGIAGSLL
jgi:hypothetical protein